MTTTFKVDIKEKMNVNSSDPGVSFFLVGADRSGTTLLRLLLNGHSRVCIPPETWWLIDLARVFGSDPDKLHPSEKLLSLVMSHARWKDWDLPETVVRDAVATLAPLVTISILSECLYGLIAARERKAIVGDKTPEYVIHLDMLARLFPRAKFIHIVRDPRDVVLSLLRAGFRGFDLFRVAAYWRWYVGRGVRDGAKLPSDRSLLIRYENLVLDAESVLKDVCAFIGIAFEPSMLEYHKTVQAYIPAERSQLHLKLKRLPQADDVERWRHEILPGQKKTIERIVGPLAERLGYQMQSSKPLFDLPYRAAMCVEWPLVVTSKWRSRIGLRRSDDARKAKQDAHRVPDA